MIFLAADIDSVPADLIKHLITLALAFFGAWMAFKRSQQGSKDQPVNIAQPLSVQKHDDAAKRSELVRIETTLKSFGDRVDGLAEQITAQFRSAQQAGEARVSAITQNIDEELKALSTRIGTLAEALHEKINHAVVDAARHGSDINHLQAEAFRHTSEIAAIRTAIQDLLKGGSKPKH
jgi:chromosome segregation ATPase